LGLKHETESQMSHRVFKWYKAKGNFPSDISELDCYYLLTKYNYFIAEQFDLPLIKQLKHLNDILKVKHSVIAFGDFTLNQLNVAIKSFNFPNHNKNKMIYIDTLEEAIDNRISIATNASSHFKSTIVYVIDNVENLNKKSVDFLLKINNELIDSNKYIICCTMLHDKVNDRVKGKIKLARLGTAIKDKTSIKYLIYLLFNETDRRKALNILSAAKMSESYFFSLASYNMFTFYGKDLTVFNHNMEVLEHANTMLYKASTKKLWRYVIFRFIITKNKRVIRFPPRNNKQTKKTVIKNNNRQFGKNIRRQTALHSITNNTIKKQIKRKSVLNYGKK